MAIGVARGGLANFQFCGNQIIPIRLYIPDKGALHRSVAQLVLLASEIKNAPVTSALRNHSCLSNFSRRLWLSATPDLSRGTCREAWFKTTAELGAGGGNRTQPTTAWRAATCPVGLTRNSGSWPEMYSKV
jgi:hypothetical protein